MSRTHVNAEFKARCTDLAGAIRRVRAVGARRRAREHQIDTYYRVAEGRLKVRETGARAELVWYFRSDSLRSKRSDVLMLSLPHPGPVKEILARTLGVKVVVDKVRRIYLRDNVRVHFDQVHELGSFVEIEAVGALPEFPRLRRQAEEMARVLGLRRSDLIRGSYSDLLVRSRGRPGTLRRPRRMA